MKATKILFVFLVYRKAFMFNINNKTYYSVVLEAFQKQ